MENASKALIIAGAILLAILLISLGILIFNQSSTVVTGSGMTDAQKASFNARFQKYESTAIKGAQVKSLINEVLAVNNDDDNENNISCNYTTTSTINNNTTYSVVLAYENGVVNSITITP